MTKKQLALRITLPLLAIVALVALIWQPASVWFRLYQLRGDEASAQTAMAEIIELGADMQAPLIDAVFAHAPEPDVGYFRPAAFEILARLRREYVLTYRGPDAWLVPLDEEAIEAMVLAYENEPSAAYRQVMRETLWGVDEWTHFAVWGRTATGSHPIEEIPDSHTILCPGPMSACGDLDVPELLSPRLAGPWCEHVGAVVRVWLESDSAPFVIERVKLLRHVENRCEFRREAIIADLRLRALDLNGAELNEVLNHAFTHHERQEGVIAALVHPDAGCDWQRRLHRALEIRRPLVGETPEILSGWVSDMDDVCLAELFEETEPEGRRERMRRSLGVSRAGSPD